MKSTAKLSPEYFATLDGMRGVAALAVVLLHALNAYALDGVVLPHAGLAVDFFFMLSGFVIAHSYDRKLLDGMGLRVFFRTRAVRLYPLVVLGALFGLAVQMLKLVLQHRLDLTTPTLYSFGLNALLLPSPFLVATEHNSAWPIDQPLWSLASEILINVAYALILAKLRTRFLLLLGLACGVAQVWRAVNGYDFGGGNTWGDLAIGPLRVAYPFIAGMLLQRLWRNKARSTAELSPFSQFHSSWPLFALPLLFCLPTSSGPKAAFESFVVMAVFPLLIWVGAHAKNPRQERSLLWLGELSYPVYVLHYPLLKAFSFGARKFGFDQSAMVYIVVALEVAASVVVAVTALRYLDEPVRRWLRRTFA